MKMTADEYKISVLIPAYNAEPYISEALNSILSQSHGNFEILIADDCSTDSTKNTIDSFQDQRIQRYHNPKNIGKTATVNQLFKRATGDLVTIHDADDISTPNRFSLQVRAFHNNPMLGMCGTSFVSINAAGNEIIETVSMSDDYQSILQNIDACSQFHGPTMMIRKSILDELGEIYRPYFENNYEDVDLARRIVDKHLSFNVPAILYKYRILTTSLCRQNVNIRNRNLRHIVSFLADERKARGTDSLMENRADVVDHHFYQITAKYRSDPALIHRQAAAYFMCWKLYPRAISESWLAVKRRPFALENFRTLQYCIRKFALEIVNPKSGA